MKTLGLVGVLAGLTYAAPAQAQVEYVLILLDRTGSMSDGVDQAGNTFWDNAVTAAQGWVTQDSGSSPLPRRAYSVWTFRNDTWTGGTQTMGQQVWPALDGSSTDCGPATNSQMDPAGTGFCLFGAGDPDVPYGALRARLGDKSDASPTTIRNAYPAEYGFGRTTLADSLCQTLELLQLKMPNSSRILLLESDGGENDSSLWCSSTNGDTALGPTDVYFKNGQNGTTFVPDWGLSVDPVNAPSWQAKVMRRGVRLVTTPPSSDPTQNATAGAAATANPIAAGENLPGGTTGIKMRIDTHFALCQPGDPPPCPGTFMMMRASSGTAVSSAEPGARSAVTYAASPSLMTTTTTSSTAGTGTPSMAADELSFFRALGRTPGSTYREVVRDPRVVYGVAHRIPGDVDDSGCTDGADFRIIKQKDVYYKRAVRPLEIAIRADLNRDGWVTRDDAAIVLSNWGRGCINPVGPKPSL